MTEAPNGRTPMTKTLGHRAAWRVDARRVARRFGLVCCVAVGFAAAPEAGAVAAAEMDAAAGANAPVVYATMCASCHGARGRGNVLVDGPVLAGLAASYIEGQLAAFRAGFRGASEADPEGMEMRPAALALDDAAVAALAAWLEALPAPLPDIPAGDASLGRQRYAPCAVCHGERGEGIVELAAPALAKQAPWYNERQMRRFIAGVRGAHPDDVWGASMRAASTGVALDDVPHLVAWLSELGRTGADAP